MTREELIAHLEHLADYVKYSEDAPALREAIKMLECSEMPNSSEERTQKRTETHACDFENLPSAQPERLTDDDFETIRIHLNAYKEKLCNQQRWEEAEEYQRIIDRFMAFASAQPENADCIYCHEDSDGYVKPIEKNCHAFIRFGMDGWELSLKANGWHGSTKIKYCPMCGRRLER